MPTFGLFDFASCQNRYATHLQIETRESELELAIIPLAHDGRHSKWSPTDLE